MAPSGTCSTRRQHTRCHRQLPWVSAVSWGTNLPRTSSEETQRPEPQELHSARGPLAQRTQHQGLASQHNEASEPTSVDPGLARGPHGRLGPAPPAAKGLAVILNLPQGPPGRLNGGGRYWSRKAGPTHCVSPGCTPSQGLETQRRQNSAGHLGEKARRSWDSTLHT